MSPPNLQSTFTGAYFMSGGTFDTFWRVSVPAGFPMGYDANPNLLSPWPTSHGANIFRTTCTHVREGGRSKADERKEG